MPAKKKNKKFSPNALDPSAKFALSFGRTPTSLRYRDVADSEVLGFALRVAEFEDFCEEMSDFTGVTGDLLLQCLEADLTLAQRESLFEVFGEARAVILGIATTDLRATLLRSPGWDGWVRCHHFDDRAIIVQV